MTKNILISIGLGFGAMVFSGCQDSQKAVRYNDSLVAVQNDIILSFLKLKDDLGQLDSADAQAERLAVLRKVENGISKAQKLSFDGDDKQFKKAFMELLKFYKKSVAQDYQELLALAYTTDTVMGHAAKMEALTRRFTKEEEQYDKAFARAQKQFATSYNFRVQENELQEEIDRNR